MKIKVGQYWRIDNCSIIKITDIDFSNKDHPYGFYFVNNIQRKTRAHIEYFKSRGELLHAYNTPLWRVLNEES